jgi:hypothetical protein
MTRIFKLTLAFVALALLAAKGLAAQPALDGKSFQGTMQQEGKKGIPDTFSFAGGQFHSSACDKYGFGRATYDAQPDGRFDATTVSPTDGTIQWHGKVEGDQLQGEALWLKSGKAPVRYQVQGTLK